MSHPCSISSFVISCDSNDVRPSKTSDGTDSVLRILQNTDSTLPADYLSFHPDWRDQSIQPCVTDDMVIENALAPYSLVYVWQEHNELEKFPARLLASYRALSWSQFHGPVDPRRSL